MAESNLEHTRHTLAHLLAAAVRELYPGAKNAIGPSIDNGFYQDFDLGSHKVSEEDFPKIEKKMREILKTWTTSSHRVVTPQEARKEFAWNEYKVELIDELAHDVKTITFYTLGDFVDLCKGGHSENPEKEVDPETFKLDRIAGAYWRGNSNNQMLTRMYGLAFSSKQELDEYLQQREEAMARDHKVLGPKYELFMFHHTAPGMPYWLPKGVVLYNELIRFWREEHQKRGYQEIVSPLLNKKELYETSGHYDHYWPDMFKIKTDENEEYGVKAMNCPNAMIVFGSKGRSYRDLPLRLSDTDTLHRNELSGTLNGLLRVREFRQDDAHCYVTEEQIESEYEQIFEIVERFYSIFGMEYFFNLSTRPDSFMGEVETWDSAEASLKRILDRSGKPYGIKEKDGAFYGPKVDIHMKDVLGRDWQMGTIQLDFQQPARFKLEYTAADGSKKTPVTIHRVIYGSMERFIGILIEHYSGAFPTWLSPVQAKILPIGEAHVAFARDIHQQMKAAGIRAEMDDSSESLGKKIRSAKTEKVPYLLVVGDAEVAAQTATLESRGGKLGALPISEIISKLSEEIKARV